MHVAILIPWPFRWTHNFAIFCFFYHTADGLIYYFTNAYNLFAYLYQEPMVYLMFCQKLLQSTEFFFFWVLSLMVHAHFMQLPVSVSAIKFIHLLFSLVSWYPVIWKYLEGVLTHSAVMASCSFDKFSTQKHLRRYEITTHTEEQYCVLRTSKKVSYLSLRWEHNSTLGTTVLRWSPPIFKPG